MRTPKQTSIIVEKTIKQIRKHKEGACDRVIRYYSRKNKISESYIRTVAGWKKMPSCEQKRLFK